MTSQTTWTLEKLLTQSKPTIVCRTTADKPTKSPKWPRLGDRIKRWETFNIETLKEKYGDLLKASLPANFTIPQASEQLSNISINQEDDINTIIGWNVAVLEPALELGRSRLGLAPGLHLEHVHENPRIPNAHAQTKVNHLINLIGSPSRILVVGLGTTSLKFQGGALAKAIEQSTTSGASKHQNPVMQLAHACRLANTRYGYIQTNNEVVACRFSCAEGVWAAEVMEIPMVLSGSGVMTTELAVWWMAMMAMPRSEDSVILLQKEAPRRDESVSAGDNVPNNDQQPSVAHPEVNLSCFGGTYDPNSEFANGMYLGDPLNSQQVEFDESQGDSSYNPHQSEQ
ncbi:unnamed protein product [Clonostachys byssicola]|uniref:Uncharacterized protein n=1 Tax=Clonostachys byssicola TaxID=160290 RepID=A0A9N9Y8N9_9HYPO|nr:unnamed protein product [Clonostachys byssicola]